MIHKPYFFRYRQALERSLLAQKSCKNAAENDITGSEECSNKKPEHDQPCSVNEQSNKTLNGIVAEPADKNIFDGFRQIAPGIFQFSQPASGYMENAVPSVLLPPCHFEVMQPKKDSDLGFKRVHGLPGPYQNYRTPVFQFT